MQGYFSATLVTDAFLVPGGGDVKIESQKLNFKEKAQAKVGSLDNVGHLPAGGAVKVVRESSGTKGRSGAVQWSLGPSRWALSPPLSLFSSHVSCTPLLFPIVHHQSWVRQERWRSQLETEPFLESQWPSLLFELISAIFRGTMG